MNAELINALFPVALVFVGVLASLTRLVKKDVLEKIPGLLFTICYPCVIIQSIAKTDFSAIIAENAYAAVFSAVFASLMLCLGLAVSKFMRDEHKKPVVVCGFMINNSTYIGLPVAQLLFGARGVAFLVVFGVVQDLFLWTAGYRLFSKKENAPMFEAFANPVMVSVAVAIILSLSGVGEIPIFDGITAAFGSMVAPLALLYFGHVLADDRSAAFRIRGRVLVLSACKVVVIPLITALVMLALPIDGFFKVMTVLIAGLPAPLIAVMLSKQFGADSDFAVEMLLCSTVMYLPVFAVMRSFQFFVA